MNSFSLILSSATCLERIDGITHFTGEDCSGRFGLLAHHERFLTVLEYGVARYSKGNEENYIALPGAVLHFTNNVLHLATQRYVHGADFVDIRKALSEQIRQDAQRLESFKTTFHHLEQQMIGKLWQLEQT